MLVGSLNHAWLLSLSIKMERHLNPPAEKAAPQTETSAGSGSPLFKGGQFIGGAQLTSPQTLAALFLLNEDGSVKQSDLGAPIMKIGVKIETTQDDMAKFLAFGPSSSMSASDRDVAARLAKITEEDRSFFRQVTGYNLFISGPAAMIVDDEGNSPSAKDRAAAEELFTRMQYARETGTSVDADWFSQLSKDMLAAGGPALPLDWESKAYDWFNDLIAARKQAEDAIAPADDEVPA